jgi:hypothetical protein
MNNRYPYQSHSNETLPWVVIFWGVIITMLISSVLIIWRGATKELTYQRLLAGAQPQQQTGAGYQLSQQLQNPDIFPEQPPGQAPGAG